MTAKENIEEKLEKLAQAIGRDDSTFESVMSRVEAKQIGRPGTIGKFRDKPIARRFIMNRFTKFAAAAVIIVAVALSITVVDKLTSPAYAFDQTVEAFKDVRFMHLIRRDEAGQIDDERWIEVGPDGIQARYRQETGGDFLVVDDRETVFAYYKDKNTVVLYDPNDHWYTWIQNPGAFFEDLAGDSNIIIEENIDYWGRKAHRVRWLKLNIDCYVDPETKLPISLASHEIYYEEPPEGVFDIPTVPEGVSLVDKRAGAPETPEPEWMKKGKIADEQFKQGRDALADERYIEAAELFARVVEVQPGRNWAWFWLGKAHYELGQYDKSIYEFSKVIDMFAKHKVVPHYCHLARGRAYAAKGMQDMARNDFDAALPVMIEALRNIEGAMMFDYADDPLCRSLPKEQRPNAQQSLAMMINRLRIISGQNFGYDSYASAEENEQVIAAWEDWFKNSGQIKFTPDAELVPIPTTTVEQIEE